MADQMALPPLKTCRGSTCNAGVRFVPVAHRRTQLIINARSHRKGTVWVRPGPDGEPVAQVLGKDAAAAFRRAEIPLYVDHHATCPNVAEFRHGR